MASLIHHEGQREKPDPKRHAAAGKPSAYVSARICFGATEAARSVFYPCAAAVNIELLHVYLRCFRMQCKMRSSLVQDADTGAGE